MNKFTKFAAILATVTLVGTASQSYGMGENWSAQVDTFLTLAGGTTGLPSGDFIAIGTNKLSLAGMQALQDNPAALFAAFAPWASTTIGTGTGLDGSWTVASTAPGAGFFSAQIYLIAFNNANPNLANQVGLFTNPAWVFPVSDGAAANTFDLADPGLQAVIGSLSAGTVTSPSELNGGNAAALHAVVVPEPSTVALAGFGLLGLVGFMRRRRS